MHCIWISKSSSNENSFHALVNAIDIRDCITHNETRFGACYYFTNKRKMYSVLYGAYKALVRAEPQFAVNGGIKYSKLVSVKYDAAQAVIVENCS